MSETATEVAPVEPTEAEPTKEFSPQEEQPDTGESQQENDWKTEAEKWKAMSRRHEKDAKANAEAARKYAEFEESQKTEQQRLADRAAAAEQRALAAEIGRAKLMAAAAYNIPTSLLDRLGGSSEDEINEAAQELAAEFEAEMERRLAAVTRAAPEAAPERPARTRPVESLTPGALPAGERSSDGNDFLRRMAGRHT